MHVCHAFGAVGHHRVAVVNVIEAVVALAVGVWLAASGYQVASERQEAGRVAADVRAVFAVATAYQSEACDRRVWTRDVDAMIAGLRGRGIDVSGPTAPASWSVRYGGPRAATAVAGPLRLAGVRIEAALRDATPLEERVLLSMGGRAQGRNVVVGQVRPPTRQRIRRARLARGGTAAERSSGC